MAYKSICPDVEEYIGEITNMAWNLGYDTAIQDNNDLVIEPRDGNIFLPTIYAKYMQTTSNIEFGDSFWFNPEMTFPITKIDFRIGVQVGFEHITKDWHEASSIAERLLEAEWVYEE